MLVGNHSMESRIPRLWNASMIATTLFCVAVTAAFSADPPADSCSEPSLAADKTPTAEEVPKASPAPVNNQSPPGEFRPIRARRPLHSRSVGWPIISCTTAVGASTIPSVRPAAVSAETRAQWPTLAMPPPAWPCCHCSAADKRTWKANTGRLFAEGWHIWSTTCRRWHAGGALNEPGGNMYAHGLASIALCEAYGMTHDKDLRAPAQAALDFIAFAQDPKGGGWRYKPHQSGDTSVFGWQLAASEAAKCPICAWRSLTLQRAASFSIVCNAKMEPPTAMSRAVPEAKPQPPSACSAASILVGRTTTPHCKTAEVPLPPWPVGREHVLQLLRDAGDAPFGR